MKLHIEAASRRYELEHNEFAWLAWHIASLQRAKKIPALKTLLQSQTTKKRQTWRQQLHIMSAWAAKHNALEKLKEKANGG